MVSYNLFFAFAFTIYNMSHTLMVPLSTRNTKQRDKLAMLTSTGTSMLPGLLVTIILPIMINAIGVGGAAQGRWITVMGILSCLAIPATLVEYYFTKERVTEDAMATGEFEKKETVSFLKQISILSKVHADRINNSWKCAKMTKKRAAFAETFGLDIVALLQEMDAMDVITAP